jgi:N-acetylglutamate synthase-like GNAT family acetyltransferase
VGGQPVPGAGRTDFAARARAAGVRRVYACDTAAQWRGVAGEALCGNGPAVVWLKVEARPGQQAPCAMRPMDEQINRLTRALGVAPAPRHHAPADPCPGSPARAVTLRTELRPGDLGAVVGLHGTVYARERGFDPTFEAYVGGPLADFVRAGSPRGRLWLAERSGRFVGCVAVVPAGADTAPLRWFLVEPGERGAGLGRRLLGEAVAFSRARGYDEIILWTESALAAAARLYHALGFTRVEERPGRVWGVDLVEEKYRLRLR